MRRGWVATAAATTMLLTACSSEDGGGTPAPGGDSRIAGEITVLTNRTDQIADGTLKKYAAKFRKLHPDVKVNFEGLTDYEGETRVRMHTDTYGDVLLIPNDLAVNQYPTYFAPLGTADDLQPRFDFTEYATVANQVYGLANVGIGTGFVYNKVVWEQAGVTEWPTTPQQFIDDLKAIRAKTQATPYYTNYRDGWPLRQWTDHIGGPNCENSAKDALATTSDPWAAGRDLNTIDGLLYSVVHEKLTEADPTTTDWESSKTLLGSGKIGAMFLGSWAVPQIERAAEAAGHNPDDIGYMPFPALHNGHLCTVVQPDYKYAVNTHSRNKAAARAWIDWYLTKSGSAQAEQAISTLKGTPLPPALKTFDERGVRIMVETQDKAAVVSRIDKGAQIGLDTPDYRRKLVDIARGAAPGDRDGYFAELNTKWSVSRKRIGG
ncbi:sugar ABC transporter substrate-binding protein [Kitasatospora herbaricolor]|uniref:ABC transporter substrate-binding protein n=1 Tax=Kitasatospora herbaricolor TaxID=68217 RepID=UPI00174816D6|nr:extracellular solute-binding protein [Kitasatospora herbaricolor]MDQ0306750.1 ABC-type glycerol-3-phosphate transport system substrate-binding protein [Kitasatospora herbaricolor]GGV44490.1 sugar ABC transporter substrate-binding protein [Kitasatospora herbaricolor]